MPSLRPSSTSPFYLSLLSLLLLFCVPSLQQSKDPLTAFCRRFDHQTAVLDDKLYIDGGLVNFNPLSQNPSNQTNLNLLWGDLKNPSKDGMPQLHTDVVTKPATVPSTSGGILWEDSLNKFFYLFGGYFPELSPTAFGLWAYDTIGNNWTSVRNIDSTFARVAHGMGTTVPERGEGYYLGGYQDNRTTPGWGAPRTYTSNLVKYDFTAGTLTNSSGPDSVGRGEGVMVYIPASDTGLLVYFGGISQVGNNSTLQAVPLTEIHIYDIASTKWYTQRASGDVPDNRMRFCAGSTWATDKSSYNIYLYGGLSPNGTSTAFDDVYILTLPAFVWIKWYPTEPGPGSPHHSLSCNVIKGSQMIVMGGSFPASDQCDAPAVWGQHNLNLGKDNPEGAKWSLFNPALTTYKVPSEIIAVVGGGSSGGATVKSPVAGSWNNRDLSVYFTRTASAAAGTPTRTIPNSGGTSPKNSKAPIGAIVGGVVGGVVVIALLILAFLFLRRRKRNSSHELSSQEGKHDNLSTPSPKPAVNAVPVELATGPGSPQQHKSPQVDPYSYHQKGASISGSDMHSPYSPATSPPIASHTPSYHTASPPPSNSAGYFLVPSTAPGSPPRDPADVIRPEQFYNTGQHSPAHPETYDNRSPPSSFSSRFPHGDNQSPNFSHQDRGFSSPDRGYPASTSASDRNHRAFDQSSERSFAAPSPQMGGGGRGRKYSDQGRSSYTNTPQQFYPPPPPPGTVQSPREEDDEGRDDFR